MTRHKGDQVISLATLLWAVACGGSETGNPTQAGGASAAANAGGAGSGGVVGNVAGATTHGGSANGGSGGQAQAGMQGGGASNVGGDAGTGGVAGAGCAAEAGSGGVAGAAGAGGAATGVCPGGDYADEPVPGGTAMASIVCSGFTFTEGPTWVASDGKLLFSDFQFQDSASNFQGRIMQLVPDAQPGMECTEFIPDVGSNGLAVTPDGVVLAARHLTQAIGSIAPGASTVTDIVTDYMDQAFSSPNDLTVRSDGTIYFTDPAWQLGNRTQELDHGVYRVDPEGNVTLVQAFPDRRPNGIILSPDESKLYVSVINPNQILVLDVATDGTASDPQTFVDAASDGMTVDCAGNLYATSLTVNVYDPTGQNIGTLSLEGDGAGLPDPTNVAFGGPNRTTLYVTGASYVRAVELQIPGLPF